MTKTKRIASEDLERLTNNASSGDWSSLLKLIESSYESVAAAKATANLLLNGRGKIRVDSNSAFAFYCMAAIEGDKDSLDIISENSSFDVDARYYQSLIEMKASDRPDLRELVDLERLFNIQGTSVPGKETEEPVKCAVQENREHVIGPEARKWLEERNRLNAKTQGYVDKRDELNQKVREIVTEAEGCKNRRNEYNLKVKEFKKLRDEANRKANAIRNGEWPIGNYRNQPSLKQLLMEKSDLENKQQTQILKKREEEALAMRLKEINRLIDAQSGTRSSMNTTRKDADHYHEQMSVYAEKAQQEHDKMMELYKKADYYREKADAAHAKFIQCKKKADEAHSKYRECLKKNL